MAFTLVHFDIADYAQLLPTDCAGVQAVAERLIFRAGRLGGRGGLRETSGQHRAAGQACCRQ